MKSRAATVKKKEKNGAERNGKISIYDVKEKHGKVEKQTGDRVWYFCKMYENKIEAEEILFIYIFIFPRTLILHFPRLLSSFFHLHFIRKLFCHSNVALEEFICPYIVSISTLCHCHPCSHMKRAHNMAMAL